MRSFSYPSEHDARASLLFLGGRGDFLEKYIETFEVWHQAGWHVAGFDWRGQGGSGQSHAEGLCHVEDFGLLLDDLVRFTRQWQRETPGPHVGIAHSMGGHLLLRALAGRLVELDGVVLLAPMLGLRAGPMRGRWLERLAMLGKLPALRDRAIWAGERSPAPGRVTSCADRQADKAWWKQQRPDLARAGPTWGWLNAAIRSIGELNRLLETAQVTTPGLMLFAANDPVVDLAACYPTLYRLPAFEHAMIADAGHELLRERDGPRHETWTRIDRFLERIVPSPANSVDLEQRNARLSRS